MVKDVKLKKGMWRDEVNRLLKEHDVDLELVDEIYGGVDYKYNWKCKCGEVFIRTWSKIKARESIGCLKCINGIKDEYENISEVYIVKGMTREIVNNFIGKWILLNDNIYLGNKYRHNWKCIKCGKNFETIWSDIRRWKNIECENCKFLKKECYDSIHEVVLIKNMKKKEINKLINNWLLLEDNFYKNNYYLHNWKCLECGNIFKRSWGNIKSGNRVKCEKCRLNIKKYYNNISEVKLKKGMDKDEVNNLVSKWLFLEDNTYLGSTHDHSWICLKCNNVFQRNWSNIKHSNRVFCLNCSDNTAAMSKRGNIRIEDSIWYNDKKISNMIFSDKFGNKVDTKQISKCSGKSFYFKCDKCGKISDRPKKLSNIYNRGYKCRYCSDGISLPEKFVQNILNQKSINFETQKLFNWSMKVRSEDKYLYKFKIYDFYLPDTNIIIEVQGRQHFQENGRKGKRSRTLKEEQANDKLKKELALINGIKEKNYIVIDCRNSELAWLKENITKSLGNIFDLSTIGWNKAWEESQNSLCVKAWELWNYGTRSTKKISEILSVNRSTVIDYLKRGKEINKCDYNPKKEMLKNAEKQGHKKSKSVILINRSNKEKKFNSLKDLYACLNISESSYKKRIESNNNIIRLDNIANTKLKNKLKLFDGCIIKYLK
ncbi:hypothetical protein [Clostridioides sp. ES-S-0190-01]|uniref:hypothetical protein n=1 Tax=Clostridioides sp. ES-S-0190-01 TaxID=2770787 RepID=UPI001D128840|nr:hypothetical protein [Clostridioides sp. ES-S-0190-01]